MEDQRVLFETAKLAFEKGFNVDTIPILYEKSGTGNLFYLTGGYDSGEDAKKYISAPTQSLLENWLFENYSINIELTFDDGQWLIYVGEFSFPDSSVEFVDSIACDSFKEAKDKKLEAKEKGLQEALKLI